MLKKMSDEELDIYLGKRSPLELLEFVLITMLKHKYRYMIISIYQDEDDNWYSNVPSQEDRVFDTRREAAVWAARKAFGEKKINALIAAFTIEE